MKRQLLIAILLLGALAAPDVAGAQDRPPPGAGSQGARPAPRVPLSRVLAMIAQRTPGRQLNTTIGESGGRPAYFVQWQMTNGQIVVFVVDAETGQIMSQ